MPKMCTACGFIPPTIEPEPPASPTAGLIEEVDPINCPNCGKEDTLQEIAEETPSKEEEAE